MGDFVYNEHEGYVRSLILHSAQESNILPLTSVCNIHCIFCSHRQNPPGVETFRIGHRTPEEIEETLEFMEPDKPVVIGESVTRIMEGEPFTHPHIKQVLKLIRSRFPAVSIQITTNGTLLSSKMVDFLAGLGDVTINLSLNSADIATREMLMKDTRAKEAVDSAVLLGQAGVSYHGSIVAMPWLTGWADLEATIHYLERSGAKTVRIFLPGYTRLAEERLCFSSSLWADLRSFVLELRKSIRVPVTFEPHLPGDFRPEVVGIIKDSPAERAGLLAGDVVLSVGGVSGLTRVQVFKAVLQAAAPKLRILRDSREFEVQLDKAPGKSSGLVMEYDLDPEIIMEMTDAVRKRRARRVLVLTSVLAGNLIKTGIDRFFDEPAEVRVMSVKSSFFGGSIVAAGLLVVSDFAKALRELDGESDWRPDLVLLPGLAFDPRGRDLTGHSYLELEVKFGCSVLAL
ncbi:DUF512 domain-containing protein [Desulfolucanica intricata]|uniref:DUF512 domain-containing protein n=1 Tax=Desulfolucanica intricata TaxID=1285191 RepID=UPI000835CD91|nr:DUF512 domain-containing protein [Desulfolucanica intricata]